MTPGPSAAATDRREGLARRLAAGVVARRWTIAIFVAALVTRLHWNLVTHPLGDYIYSDMGGYVARAIRLLEHPTQPDEYSAFFPFGTHWLVAGLQLLFGRENFEAISVVWALMGAITVAAAYAAARRASAFAIVPPAVGLLGIFYYPHLSLGGYLLSETPFCMFLMLALAFSLRLVDHGRYRDAWAMGIFCALGVIFRPQILLSAAAIGLFWIVRRKSMPNVRLVHLLHAAIPIALMLGASAYHLHANTGRHGLVSENGSINLMFGRCHPTRIQSLPDDAGHGSYYFSPPPFLQLQALERQLAERGREPPRTLDPAIGDAVKYRGYIGDKRVHMQFVRQCIAKTGWLGQLDYTVTNVMLLWRWNVPWPDSYEKAFTPTARRWTKLHRDALAVPALLGLVMLFVGGSRTVRQGLFAVNLLALLVLAAVVFGGTRHRAPYDFVIISLAFEVYAAAAWAAVRLARHVWARWRARRS